MATSMKVSVLYFQLQYCISLFRLRLREIQGSDRSKQRALSAALILICDISTNAREYLTMLNQYHHREDNYIKIACAYRLIKENDLLGLIQWGLDT